MNFKHFLETSDPRKIVEVYGKNNLPICQCTAECHLITSPDLLKKKVLYDGLNEEGNAIVVLGKKVKIY